MIMPNELIVIIIVFCFSSLRVFEDTIGLTDSSESEQTMIMPNELIVIIIIVFCFSSLRVFEDTIGMTDSSDSYIRTDNDNV